MGFLGTWHARYVKDGVKEASKPVRWSGRPTPSARRSDRAVIHPISAPKGAGDERSGASSMSQLAGDKARCE